MSVRNVPVESMTSDQLLSERNYLVGAIQARLGPSFDNLTGHEQDLVLAATETLTAELQPIADELNLRQEHLIRQAEAQRTVAGGHFVPLYRNGDGQDYRDMVGGRPQQQGPQYTASYPAKPAYGTAARIGPQPFEAPGIAAARFTKVFMAAGGNLAMCDTIARSMYPDDRRVDFTAALMTAPASAGGFLVPETYSTEIIELLRNRSVIRRNVRVLPFRGTMVVPQLVAGTQAQYLGEMIDDLAQDITFSQKRLTERKLRALVAVSNDLIRSSRPEADEIVRDDLARALGEAENSAFIRGPGDGNAPKGLRYWARTADVSNGSGTTSAQIETDVIGMATKLVTNLKGQQQSPRWLMSTRSFFRLFNAKDPSNVTLLFPEIRANPPRLLGSPVDITDAIPTTLSPGTVTEIYLYDASQVIVGDSMSIAIAMSDVAAYRDAQNNLQSAFSQDASVLRAISLHDLMVRQDGSVVVLTGSNVTW